MTESTLQAGENLAAAVQKTPNRVTLDSIMAKVATIEYHNPIVAPHMTVAFVKLVNGFVAVGKSAPADPANFDVEAGKKFAVDDALRAVWGLEGYLLCELLAREA
jgi:hypothetical protein